MLDPKWRSRFFEAASLISSWSKDPSTKVGALIFDGARRVIGLGYNGFPRGIPDHPMFYEDRETKLSMIVHAEANAIMNANKSVKDCGILSTKFPCTDCAKLIIQSGVIEVFAPRPEGRWANDAEISVEMFKMTGIEITYIGE